jgi:hydrogenase nickel incorporation protein HypB
MCATCGCSDTPTHEHPHGHDHGHGHGHTRVITLEQDVLAKNDLLAARNRDWFAEHGIVALNLMSSPGAGKTTLLERTIRDIGAELSVSVGAGAPAPARAAPTPPPHPDRIRATGCAAVQINTGSGCHLDAEMLARGLRTLRPPDRSVVMIENVGNLVCPALFDLGEEAKVVIMSVTEGADKPLKYPQMFRAGSLLLLNKVDLLPHVDFDMGRCTALATQVNPDLEVLPVSATRGDGLDAWYAWLRTRRS